MEAEEPDLAFVPVIDLRFLCQDEIDIAARVFPATRAEELLKVIPNKPMFNESVAGRRQTFDKERFSRSHRPKLRLSRAFPSPVNSRAVAAAGMFSSRPDSNRDLVLRLCKRLNIDASLLPPLPCSPPPLPPPVPPPFTSTNEQRTQKEPGNEQNFRMDSTLQQLHIHSNSASISNFRSLKQIARIKYIVSSDGSSYGKNGFQLEVHGAVENSLKQGDSSLVSSKKVKPIVAEDPFSFQSIDGDNDNNDDAPAESHIPQLEALDTNQAVVVVDAVGFPSGWKVCVDIKDTGTELTTEVVKFISPKDQEFYSYEEANRGLRAVAGHASNAFTSAKHHTMVARRRENSKTLPCSCGKLFSCLYTIRRHVKNTGHTFEYRKTMIKQDPCFCTTCGKAFVNKRSLRRHAQSSGHSEVKPLLSELEFKSEIRKSLLDDLGYTEGSGGEANDDLNSPNIKRELLVKTLLTGDRRHECRLCHKRFLKRYHLNRHFIIHFRKGMQGFGDPGKLETSVTKSIIGDSNLWTPKFNVDGHFMHSSGKRKRRKERQHRAKATRIYQKECKVRGDVEDVDNFTCWECGENFDEYMQYSSHTSLHISRQRMHGKNLDEDGIKQNLLSDALVAQSNNGQGSMPLPIFGFRELLIGETGTYLSGLPAKLLFSELLENSLSPRSKEINMERNASCSHQSADASTL